MLTAKQVFDSIAKKSAIVQAKYLEIHDILTSQRNQAQTAKRKYIKQLTCKFNGRNEAKAKVQEYRQFCESKSDKEDTDSDWDSDGDLSLTGTPQNLAKTILYLRSNCFIVSIS